jgi:hypothetical protein
MNRQTSSGASFGFRPFAVRPVRVRPLPQPVQPMRTAPIKPQLLAAPAITDVCGRPLTAFDPPAPGSRGWCRRAARLWLIAVGVILAATALDKLMHLPAMVSAVAAYNLVPPALAGVAAAAVITAEITGSLLLLVPRWQPKGAIVAIVLFAVFAVVVAASVVNRMDIDCGCSNLLAPSTKVSWLLAGRNLALTLACVVALDQFRAAGTATHGFSRFLRLGRNYGIAAAALTASVYLTARWQTVNTGVLNASRGTAVPGIQRQTAASRAEANPVPPPQAATAAQANTPRPACPPITGFDFSQSDETWLFVFSTTCDHCKAIMPIWNRLYAENKPRDQAALRMIGVVITGEPTDEFRRKHGIAFPLHSPTDPVHFLRTLNIDALPHAVLANRHGHILEQLW